MLRTLALLVALAAVPFGPWAASPVAAQVAAPQPLPPAIGPKQALLQESLVAALRLPDLISVMHDEGIDYGKQLADQLFPGQDGGSWHKTVRRIYAPKQMTKLFEADFSPRLDDNQRKGALEFLTSPLGRRIVAREISARRAMLDPDVEAEAAAQIARMAAHHDPRLAQIRRFARINGLVEANVAGALNANFAFYTGLADGHAPGLDLSRNTILSDVSSQQPEVTKETRAWLFPFLVTAYKPLSNAELDRYIAFSQSASGKALNRALFAAFDVMFVHISHELGLAAASVMAGENL
ncbi:hypothetical protein U879_04155 [Defluviimonas sp. 20V17]|uniref:DUF2059 domain-containing protein n=1 Tax=Allgaiera indica TaxID=765699 RepID=A0AAN4UUL2_9RHOB|nr:DUF2059 domain-containing protein [Allgaiera indica]KDB04939.1 hypothetical protein U879_04155 [Defluviimonas sp. 20V17]GHE05704.1 hypothetical protein GCM10008024_37510 [Allgaiera indica]SDX76467.1 hypothetical protein SAMN05444006_12823 [Allgaiera indica]